MRDQKRITVAPFGGISYLNFLGMGKENKVQVWIVLSDLVNFVGLGGKDGCEHRIKSRNKSALSTVGTHIHLRSPGGVGRGVDLPSPLVLEGATL